jgi:Polyketide synthase dehydratase N-terminal domain/Polyketide synthase dehydratase domain
MVVRKSVQIPVQPWFKDHCFNGETIFPAVESMLLLAEIAKEVRPDIQTGRMTGARFLKFLSIPENATTLSVLVEYQEEEEHRENFSLKLLSKVQFKKMSRIKEHAEISFSLRPLEISPVAPITAAKNDISIQAERIYQELVPFGPTYHSLTGTLRIAGSNASGSLQAPTVARQQKMEKELGSPFPLDGAMHAACVLGQCIADFVPFPVGFSKRVIYKPTQAGKKYNTTVIITSRTKDELLFDLSIFDLSGNVCETVQGLRMRDVSRGMVTPPADLPKPPFFPQKPW